MDDRTDDDMDRDRAMLRERRGHGSSPGPSGTDPGKAQKPYPTPGDEHLEDGDEQ